MMRKHSTADQFPIHAGDRETVLAYSLLHNRASLEDWNDRGIGYREAFRETIDFIVECRADGMTEREVIRQARRYVREWFESGMRPDPIVSPAVELLAHTVEEYPIIGKERFVELLNGRGWELSIVEWQIADCVRCCKIKADGGRYGVEYRLGHEPITREIKDLAERVPPLMVKYPGGVPFGELRHTAARVLYRGLESGAALIERALNAEVLRAEIRAHGDRRERYIFPNLKTKSKTTKSQNHERR